MAEKRRTIAQYAAKSKDRTLLRCSTSGGVFTELARVALMKGGVVVGVEWAFNPFRAVFRVANKESQIPGMRGAKYVWSGGVRGLNVGDCGGLFMGLPCQIAAARRIYGDKFVYCALICHSTPEPDVWTAYVASLEHKHKARLINVQFRDKVYGRWRRGMFVAEFSDGVRVIESDNIFTNAYFMGLSTRLVCTKCNFKCGGHGADIMIGDFWGIENVYKEFDDGNGVNAVLVFTERGYNFLHSASLEMIPVSYADIIAKNPYVEECVQVNMLRRQIFMSSYPFLGIRLATRIACSRIGNMRCVVFAYCQIICGIFKFKRIVWSFLGKKRDD